MNKKLTLIIFILGLLSFPVQSKEIYETEKEFYDWHNRYKQVETMPYDVKLGKIREITKNPDYETDEKLIEYQLLFAEDMVKKGITNSKLIEKFIQNACLYNISLSRFRIKDPNFNIYFESNVIDDTELRDFYDKLIDNNWVLGDIDSMTKEQKKEIRIKLSRMFNWSENETYSDKYITNSLKIANLYFQHPDFKNNYFCPNTKESDACFLFTRRTIGIPNQWDSGLINKQAYKFIEESLKNPNTDTDSLGYLISHVIFDKTPSAKLIKAINNGEFSDTFMLFSQPLSELEKTLDERSKLVTLLKYNQNFTEEQKRQIFYFDEYTINEKNKIIETVIKNPYIEDKFAAVNTIFTEKRKQAELKDTMDSVIKFPFSLFEQLKSLP